ncbi:MAG TPA: BamA/TamA family outer membrane protein [Verrucomicrobiae bacterium]|nr:BamA/TamA family outer membrane protein [Verrucomicrobiae bacterium]
MSACSAWAAAGTAVLGARRACRWQVLLCLRCLGWLFLGAHAGWSCAAAAATHDAKTNAPAIVKVSGLGILGNREMGRLLRSFQPAQERTLVNRTFVEDSALVLLSRMSQEGYLSGRVQARFVMADGTRQTFLWTNAPEVELPRDFAAREARFRLQRGPRSYYKSLKFEGSTTIPPKAAARYFVGGDTLFDLRANRIYTQGRLASSLRALHEALRRKGYADATVTAQDLEVNRVTGAARVKIKVVEGIRSMVREVAVEITGPTNTVEHKLFHPGEPYSTLWQQEFGQRLREEQNIRGYPDTTVDINIVRRETNSAMLNLDLLARVNIGTLVPLGHVSFRGHEHTRTSVLERLVHLKEGAPLNLIEAEQARQRLARVGVFDWVTLRYDHTNEPPRDVIYDVSEGKPVSLSILGGYGSYELLRGGFEVEHRNVLGLAHDARLRALQSFKASSGDLLYTVPEFLFEHVNLFGHASGLRREEVSFTRLEYGAAVGLQKRLTSIQTDMSVRYDYEFLNALNLGATDTNQVGVTEARAAAIVIDLTRDRLDNPLTPHQGLKLFANTELASSSLGGNVNYQRVVLSASYHQDLGGGRLAHLGLTHGLTFTAGGTDEELPFNKRFFPGGENSVRGYQQGEASPLDARGHQLGAETFTQANVELEQLLTQFWSVVGFFDAVGFAQSRSDYPWDEGLYSAGGGIRWRTIIGPARLEYGHNLNRRRHDPAGTLHVSIGFPF